MAVAAPQPDALTKGFTTPPPAAKPYTWWHWMNGNITREGITADLEAMKRAGVGGATIFSISEAIPPGPVKILSPQWFSMIKFAASEANRLGLELTIHNCPGWSGSGGPWVTPANAMQMVTSSETQVTGPTRFESSLPQPETRQGLFREISVLAFPTPSNNFRLSNLRQKAGYEASRNIEPAQGPEAPTASTLDRSKVINLTPQFHDGKLAWEVPAGNWTILRLGYTPIGVTNHPAPPDGTGLEVDKLSKSALDTHWNGMMQPVLNELGSLAGKSLSGSLIDSYEVGGQNWTSEFATEFQKRRGYDITPYLPIFTGRVVGTTAQSERFLWDVRRTIADLMDENYYGHFSELCHRSGLKSLAEPYSDGPFEDLTAGGTVDIPMGEFWVSGWFTQTCKLAASVGHVYGQPIIGAESFTADPGGGKWTNDPYSLKAIGDQAFCNGINRFIFHRYAMQPWLNRFPGMTMGQWGIHFERTNTLWDSQSAWLQYIQRSQYLLQQGHFVADALAFTGSNPDSLSMPTGPPILFNTNPALPAGYDYDVCSSDGLVKRLSVKNGLLVTPGGTSYRVLILPPNETMQPATLRKIRDLMAAGAILVGAPPKHSPSLQNYPQCDAEIASLVAQIWGNCDGKTITSHSYGKGKVFWGVPLERVFASLKTLPDFSVPNSTTGVDYIHRRTANADIYFVSNQRRVARELECSFRVKGKVPELWHPDSGRMEDAPIYRETNEGTSVPLRFDAADSVFVVFRRTAKGAHLVASKQRNTSQSVAAQLAIVKAVYEGIDGGGSADVTDKVRSLVQDNALSFTANNAIFGDPAYMHVKRLRVDYMVDGKERTAAVDENQSLDISADSEPGKYPDYEWTTDANGNPQLVGWKAGNVQLQSSNGKTRSLNIPSVPAPTQIGASWTLSFPPNWGAPPQVTLPNLISWTQHSDPGVRYFSGTATYTKNFTLSPSSVDANKVISLDLGQVKNIARVKVNGRDLGTLWKPPFRVNLSGVAHAGINKLEVQVTNLWPNRLIGDEQLPPDVEWDGVHLKAWPQWLLDGKPSPTGRLTFTTWHHWTKDSPLLDSGLLGPVSLHVGNRIRVKP